MNKLILAASKMSEGYIFPDFSWKQSSNSLIT